MLKKTLVIAASVAALGLSLSANAQIKNTGFDRMDTNKNGFVEKEEYLAKTAKKFEKIDTNKDGKISKEELKAFNDAIKSKRAARKSAEKEPEATPVEPKAATTETK